MGCGHGLRARSPVVGCAGCQTLLAVGTLIWLHPVTDQQSTDNVVRALSKFQQLGVLPAFGQVRATRAFACLRSGAAARTITSRRPQPSRAARPCHTQRMLGPSGPMTLRPHDIVDANREATLGVLWRIVLRWALPRLVDRPALLTETRRVLRLVAAKLKRPAPVPLDVYPDKPRISALLGWVQAVAMLHGMRVHNFTSSFGDGRALCYLVRAHPPRALVRTLAWPSRTRACSRGEPLASPRALRLHRCTRTCPRRCPLPTSTSPARPSPRTWRC